MVIAYDMMNWNVYALGVVCSFLIICRVVQRERIFNVGGRKMNQMKRSKIVAFLLAFVLVINTLFVYFSRQLQGFYQ